MTALPDQLREKIDEMLHGVSTEELSLHYKNMSTRYRRLGGDAGFQIGNRLEALAYMTARMPATFGAVSHALNQLQKSLPDFVPETILDGGAGPGTATQACFDVWPDLKKATLIEPNQPLREISLEILKDKPCEFQPKILTDAVLDQPHDLAILSYVLNELPADEMTKSLERLWSVTEKALVIIEPGTPYGYELVLKAREKLIAKGAYIAAPCPHMNTCPLAGSGKWCHIATRIDRTSIHRRIKSADGLSYEDEKFSYLIASRIKPELPSARLIGNPHGNKLVTLELCKNDGTAVNKTLSKRDAFYKRAGKAKWGDPIPQGENI